MDAFLALPSEERRLYYEQAEGKVHLPPATIEKDLWVCWSLKTLFRLPGCGHFLTFKGGTSLSKGWSLIDRFSEDIDIVIDRHALGFGGADAPDQAPSKNQRRLRCVRSRKSSTGKQRPMGLDRRTCRLSCILWVEMAIGCAFPPRSTRRSRRGGARALPPAFGRLRSEGPAFAGPRILGDVADARERVPPRRGGAFCHEVREGGRQ